MLLAWIAEQFGRHRWLVAVGLVALTSAAAVGMGRLQFDDVPRSVFKTRDDDYARLEELFREFGSDDNECLLVVEGDDLFSPRSVAALRDLVREVSQVEGVDTVRSMAEVLLFTPGAPPRPLLPPVDAAAAAFSQARDDALAHPLLRGQLVSDDARTTLVVAKLAGETQAVNSIAPLVARLQEVAENIAVDSGLRVRLTGVPSIRVEIYAAVQRESNRFIFIGAGLGFVMAMALFRQFSAALIVAAAPILGSLWTLGMLGLAGVKINIINTILPTLVMVVGFADSMHLMIDIRHNRAAGLSRLEAAKRAIQHLGVACLLTSSTTAVGFGSLALAEVGIIRIFGVTCAFGTMLSYVAVMSLVPLLASTPLGENLHRRESQDFIARHFVQFERAIGWIARHARPVAIVGALVTAALTLSMWRLEPDNRLVEMIPVNNESYQALKHCDRNFGGSLSAFITVDWPQGQDVASPEVIQGLREVHRLIEETPELNHPISVLNLLQSLPGTGDDLALRTPFLAAVPADVTRRYLRPERRRALVVARLPDMGTAKLQPVFADLDARLATLGTRFPDLNFKLTGTVVVASRNINKMINSLNQSLLGAATVIFVSIGIGFRSLRLALISILPNIFPLVFVSSYLVLTGQTLQITSVIVFSVSLGIAVDDTIHFLNRFKREMEIDGDVQASIRRAFLAVGSAVVTTTLVLLTGFGSVLTSEMPSSRLFASLSCLAFASAVVGDLLMLPALLTCFMKSHAKPARARQAAADGS